MADPIDGTLVGGTFLVALVGIGLCVASCGDSSTDEARFASPDADTLFLIHFTVTDPNGNVTSLVSATPDLSADTTIDASRALEIPGYVVLIVSEFERNTFFVARVDAPVLERYSITDQGDLEQTGRLSFAALGTSRAALMLRPIHFISAERALFIDSELPQAIVWNPRTMEIERSFRLEGLQSTDGTTPILFDSREDQGRLIVSSGYRRPDTTHTPTGRIAIIDLETEEVIYDEQDRCGWLTTSVVDESGSIYFVSHPGQGAHHAAEADGDLAFPPCMVRMRSGADAFDPDYFLDLSTLVNRPAAAVAAATEGRAYVTIYPEGSEAFTRENREALRFSADWEFHSFVLGDANATVSKVDQAPRTADQVGAGQVEIDTESGERALVSLITISTDDFAATTLYDVSDPDRWVQGVTVPGFVYSTVRVR